MYRNGIIRVADSEKTLHYKGFADFYSKFSHIFHACKKKIEEM